MSKNFPDQVSGVSESASHKMLSEWKSIHDASVSLLVPNASYESCHRGNASLLILEKTKDHFINANHDFLKHMFGRVGNLYSIHKDEECGVATLYQKFRDNVKDYRRSISKAQFTYGMIYGPGSFKPQKTSFTAGGKNFHDEEPYGLLDTPYAIYEEIQHALDRQVNGACSNIQMKDVDKLKEQTNIHNEKTRVTLYSLEAALNDKQSVSLKDETDTLVVPNQKFRLSQQRKPKTTSLAYKMFVLQEMSRHQYNYLHIPESLVDQLDTEFSVSDETYRWMKKFLEKTELKTSPLILKQFSQEKLLYTQTIANNVTYTALKDFSADMPEIVPLLSILGLNNEKDHATAKQMYEDKQSSTIKPSKRKNHPWLKGKCPFGYS